MYGTGGRIDHCTMALWIEEDDGTMELYIVEAQSGPNWPTDRVQRNRFDTWMKWAEDTSYHVAWIPLSADKRAQFNHAAVLDYFYQIEGMPYGYHNYLFGWIDTPNNNTPPVLPEPLLVTIFGLLEKFSRNTTDTMFSTALNLRAGTKGLGVVELASHFAKQNMTLMQAAAMIEQDNFVYTGFYHDGVARVCSSFVVDMYKHAGLFNGHPINAAEFTPKDLYMLNFFDPKPARPQACIDADPDLFFCQLLGKYKMEFPLFNTITVYDHMNEHCPTLGPDYVRPAGC